jgi:hypothetical protein
MKKMTLEQHVEFAKFIRDTYNKLQISHVDLCYCYGKTSKVAKKLKSVLDKLDGAKSELDNHYHAVATDKDFEQHGHLYYRR